MAEPLKDSFGPDVAVRIADMIEVTNSAFDRTAFLEVALDGFEGLELTPRARRISDALAATLPGERARAIDIIVDSLGPEIGETELTGLDSFVYLPLVFFVADHGLECFETSMRAQYELTKRFTAEFSIRAFLERYPAESLQRLSEWAHDPNVHVRRLVSEGTRPRLPWARRLRAFQDEPAPVLELLELLKDDSEEYVRRSVANNLNDISKDHPDVVVQVAKRWWSDGSEERRRLIRHGLRSLIKGGDAGALEVLGYAADSPVQIQSVRCEPSVVEIGDKVRIEVGLLNDSEGEARALVDLRVHFMKSLGTTSPKVFKGAELAIGPKDTATIRKTISVAQHSTRKHYPGEHSVEVLLNGIPHPGAKFDIVGLEDPLQVL
jgi:3-methyladenine DNA glycosylase AlkC